MKFFAALMTAIGLVPQLLSLVDQVVVNVEQGIGQIPGITGSKKLAAAEAKVDSFLKDAITDVNVLTDVRAMITPIVNAAVAAFNASGLFTHKPAPAANEPTVQPGPPPAVK